MAIARDARHGFRAVFCALLAERQPEAGACEDYLWRLDDEPSAEGPPPPPALDPALRVFLVGGAFSDCFGSASVLLPEGARALQARGAAVEYIPVSGRSGATSNARRIADFLRAAQPAAEGRTVLLGYSKGAVDILHFLADFPGQAEVVDAVVNLSGPVRGSRVAQEGAWVYDAFLSHAFPGRCDPGDGAVVDSLRRDVQGPWLAENPPPPGVDFYTLSAFTTREHLARGLKQSWGLLARGEEPRNDGQVSLAEGLLPGSTLLGYLNADHWGIAITIERELDFLAARRDPRPFPQATLLEAVLRYLSAERAEQASQAVSAAGGRTHDKPPPREGGPVE